MKFIILGAIKLYQIFTPKYFRGKCLFKESCSNYVYRKTKEEGFLKGVKAFRFRYKNCRSGYYIHTINNEKYLISKDLKVFDKTQIRDKYLKT